MTKENGVKQYTGKRLPIVWVVFFTGLLGVAVGTIGIRTAHDVSWIKFFDNLHWTSGTAAAAILGWLGYTHLKGTERGRTLFWFALGLTLYAMGQVVWDIQTAIKYTEFPSPSDLFYIWLGPGLCVGLLREIHRHARKSELAAIRIDILVLLIASLTLVLALYLPRRGTLGITAMTVLTAYPATLIAATCIGVAMVPILRLKNTVELWMFLVSVAVTAWSWMTWNLMALAGTATDGTWFNISFSISVLFMGLAISDWNLASSENPAWDRVCEGALRLLPLLSVIAACAAVIAVSIGAEVPADSEKPVQIGSVLVIVLAAIRQMMLLQERDLLLAAQKEIIASRALLRTVIDATPVRVFWKDRQCRYLGSNAAFAADAGVTNPDALIGRMDDELPWKEQSPLYQADDREVMESGRPKLGYEEPQTIPGGRAIVLRTSKVPLKNDNDEVIGVVGVYEDITDRKQAEAEIHRLNAELEQRVIERTAQLEAAVKELEDFAYTVSHNLRSPLRHIDGFLELLQKRTPTLDEKSQHYMATISDSARHMGLLIDDLLSFLRMGRNEISKSQVNLDELVQDVIREFGPEAEGRNIHWKIFPLPLITGDRAMLRVVLVNLISNALKFTHSRSPAVIEIGRMSGEDGMLTVFVRDNGVGFDMNYADKLFGVFQRLHGADEFEGAGIGLANVRRIIHRHNGKVWAEGETGCGATFYFSIPQIDQQGA